MASVLTLPPPICPSDYTNYLFCVVDVACSCGLVKNGTEPVAEAVYRNVTKVHYLMLSQHCSLQGVPISVLQSGLFECYDTMTALPITMGQLQLSFAEDQVVQQWSHNCPAVIKCAGQFDITLAASLSIKNFPDVCQNTLTVIQCSQEALTSCGLFSTTEARAFYQLLTSKLEGCDTGKMTITKDPGSSNFGTDAIVSANNSQSHLESAKAGSLTTMSSASSQLVLVLLCMTSLWIMCQ
ncbi:unnamed protein product [Candidula unifasciata]|uniref:Uncharacterized protein n=1 Tax=Candidula unifasciata TaxID=100452 RepID=A0A8S3Z3D3_9EUPU|nr:unnamed protein product [Candidula unifasciata]